VKVKLDENLPESLGEVLVASDHEVDTVINDPPGAHPGILVLRLANESAAAVREAISELLAHHRLDDLAGTVTVLHHGRLRIRLP
jgi:hypothetical protein